MKRPLSAAMLAAALLCGVSANAAAPPAKPAKQAAKRQVLPFIHDDYAQALAQAKAKKLPIFVEAWAPW
jgi:hypothetical protein